MVSISTIYSGTGSISDIGNISEMPAQYRGFRVSPAGGLGSHKPIIRVVGRQEDVRGDTNQSGVTYQKMGANGPRNGDKRPPTPPIAHPGRGRARCPLSAQICRAALGSQIGRRKGVPS